MVVQTTPVQVRWKQLLELLFGFIGEKDEESLSNGLAALLQQTEEMDEERSSK